MLIVLSPARAWADERSNLLRLTVAAPAEESARLEAVTRELLEPFDVTLEVRRVPRIDLAELRRAPERACFARVWIALSATGSAKLYLEHGASDRLLLRDVPGDPNNPELVREELGHILQAAVEGLKAGEQVGEPRREALAQVAPEPPPRSAPHPEPRAPRRAAPRRPLWGGGARYEGRWWGDRVRFEDGPGVVLALTTRLGAEASIYYRRPLRVKQDPVGARFESISLRALVTYELLEGLRLGAGSGSDFVRVTPSAGAAGSFTLTEPASRRLLLGRVQLTYSHPVRSWLQLQLSAGADVDASGTRYVLERSAGEVTITEPSPLRPFISLGAMVP